MRKKIALVFLGLLVWFVVMEAGMRAAGMAMRAIQHSSSRHSPGRSGDIRILCIGESTTEVQYPHILEEILNARMEPLRVRVIDRGAAGRNSTYLINKLPDDISKFKPHIIISMMGVNDDKIDPVMSALPRTRFGRLLHSSRVYKLARMLALSAANKVKEYVPFAFGPEAADRLYNIGRRYYRQDRFVDAVIYFKRAVARDPGSYDAVFAQCLCYRYMGADSTFEEQMARIIERWPDRQDPYKLLAEHYLITGRDKDAITLLNRLLRAGKADSMVFCSLGWAFNNTGMYASSLEAFENGIALDPLNPLPYHGLASVYMNLRDFDRALPIFRKSIELAPSFANGYAGYADACIGIGQYGEAEKTLMKAVKIDPQSSTAYAHLVGLYTVWQKPSERKYYQSIVDSMRSDYYNSVTVRNYHQLKRLAENNGVLLVCAQYPLRSVAYLKRLFNPDPGGIVFVDNKKIFQDAVAREGYDSYFVDLFAGDFGHLNKKGNRLLAGNIADKIMPLVQGLSEGGDEYRN